MSSEIPKAAVEGVLASRRARLEQAEGGHYTHADDAAREDLEAAAPHMIDAIREALGHPRTRHCRRNPFGQPVNVIDVDEVERILDSLTGEEGRDGE